MNLLPIDIPEGTFEVDEGVQFDPLKPDYDCPEKEKALQAVVKILKKVIDLSNANIIKKC